MICLLLRKTSNNTKNAHFNVAQKIEHMHLSGTLKRPNILSREMQTNCSMTRKHCELDISHYLIKVPLHLWVLCIFTEIHRIVRVRDSSLTFFKSHFYFLAIGDKLCNLLFVLNFFKFYFAWPQGERRWQKLMTDSLHSSKWVNKRIYSTAFAMSTRGAWNNG